MDPRSFPGKAGIPGENVPSKGHLGTLPFPLGSSVFPREVGPFPLGSSVSPSGSGRVPGWEAPDLRMVLRVSITITVIVTVTVTVTVVVTVTVTITVTVTTVQ